MTLNETLISSIGIIPTIGMLVLAILGLLLATFYFLETSTTSQDLKALKRADIDQLNYFVESCRIKT